MEPRQAESCRLAGQQRKVTAGFELRHEIRIHHARLYMTNRYAVIQNNCDPKSVLHVEERTGRLYRSRKRASLTMIVTASTCTIVSLLHLDKASFVRVGEIMMYY